MKSEVEWWNNGGGFFGQKYIEGDDSIEGFIPGKKERLSERTKREVEGVIKLTKTKKEDRILDIPCGYGRHSIELTRNGFSVTGIDINEEHLKIAKKNSEGQQIKFLKKDMRNIGKDNYNQFDLVGFFEKEKDNEKTIKEFYNALRKNGKFLLHTDISPEMFEGGKYRFKEERNLAEGKTLIIEEKYNNKNKRMEGSWTIISKNGEERLTPYSVRIYSKEEFEELAKRTGFKKIKFYGSFEGEKFTSGSPELIMVAEK